MAGSARAQIAPKTTLKAYLFDEGLRPDKHEFHAGYVYAMAGGSHEHSLMQARVSGELYLRLKGTRCSVAGPDIKVWIDAEQTALYPDAVVTCGKPVYHQGNRQLVANPLLVVEVLSPSTREYDLGKKFAIYRQLLSLHDYLLIEPDEVYVIHYTKDARGSWRKKTHQMVDASIELPSLKASIPLRDLYPNH